MSVCTTSATDYSVCNGVNGTSAYHDILSVVNAGYLHSDGLRYVGGGGGGYPDANMGSTPSTGGIGGGGPGSRDATGVDLPANRGLANTGGGGGAADQCGMAGGSGLAVLMVPDTVPIASTTGGCTTFTAHGTKYLRFTSSGTVTFGN